ncbi:MAG: 4Fe-4S binding protein [Geminicoccaceae bacterium]
MSFPKSGAPGMDPERCVAAISPLSTCDICIGACPTGAWSLTDRQPELDENACDGCGICIAACPQDALSIAAWVDVRRSRAGLLAMAACMRVAPFDAEGTIPCLHALGYRQIQALRARGIGELHVRCADCEECPRGRAVADSGGTTIVEAVKMAAGLMADTGEKPLTLHWPDAARWQRLAEYSESFDGSVTSRRGLWRRLVGDSAPDGARSAMEPPTGERLVAFSPGIDPAQCEACGICATLCPTGAITNIQDERIHAYRIEPALCSGCNLCLDVCDSDAIEIVEWTRAQPSLVELEGRRCGSCDAEFQAPQGQEDAGNCPVCRRRPRPSPRYPVVMDD